MRIHLDYGRDGLDVEVPDRAQVLHMAGSPALENVDAQIAHALRHPIGTPALSQLAKGRRDACVVISDITRPVPNAVILPPMLRTLEQAGIPRERITILVATGLHRPNEGEELVALVGAEIAAQYRILNHRARDRETLAHIGETSCGAPIWIDKVYIEADLKISTALIEPHLMAGYSGGRKAICPGLMGVDTMRVLHGPRLMGDPRSAEGIIEGNPFHRQALEVAQKAGVDFTFNVSMNAQRQVTGLFCGDLEKAHAEGVAFVERQAQAQIARPVPIVVTTSAGHPLDLTLYQAVKGLTAVLPIVEEGGTILIAARCQEGIGSPEFTEELLNAPSPEAFLKKLEDPDFFAIDQWQLQELCKVLRKARVMLYSEGMNPAHRGRLLMDLVPSVEEGLRQALDRHGAEAPIAVVPKGPYVLTRVSGGGR
ncbi:MAG: nickel-dependent lactate racemase [Candidatus Latescibacteria bacterium]|nr:nickel-dependent lactate racemase [Candidatus Latescibacterota bacterium]